MDKEQFELLGFTTETLPSGYLNVINKEPFVYNGCTTVILYRGGQYTITTTHKTIESFFNTLRELRTIDPASLHSRAPIKKKTKTVKETHQDVLEPVTDQSLAEFLTSQPAAPVKTRRKRKV